MSKRVRLTESDFINMITEEVEKILVNEAGMSGLWSSLMSVGKGITSGFKQGMSDPNSKYNANNVSLRKGVKDWFDRTRDDEYYDISKGGSYRGRRSKEEWERAATAMKNAGHNDSEIENVRKQWDNRTTKLEKN